MKKQAPSQRGGLEAISGPAPRRGAGIARQRNGDGAIGALSLLALGVNGIVGVGIFFAPGAVAAALPGMLGIWVYPLTALCLLPLALAFAFLGKSMPEDGGPYVWARAAFGPNVAFAVGWIAYVSAAFSLAAVVVGFSQYAGASLGLHTELGQRGFGLFCLVALGVVAASGLKPSALVWSSLTLFKLLPLLLLIAAFAFSDGAVASTERVASGSWWRAALMVVFTLQGFEVVPVLAGKVRRVGVAIPLSTVGSLVFAAGLYTLLHASCVAGVQDLAQQRAPLVSAALSHQGPTLATVVAQGANISALGVIFGMIAVTPRYLSVLGRAGAMSTRLGQEDSGRVPRAALAVTISVAFILVVAGRLGELFVLSSVAVLMQYAVSLAALGRLALAGQSGLRPRHALPVPFGMLAIIALSQAVELREVVITALALLAGVALFVFQKLRQRQAR